MDSCTLSRFTSGGSMDITMDPSLWGKLQHHIDMKLIFAKLPFREFFQYRLVCKDWDRLAADKKFLQDSFKHPLSKPYFVIRNGSPHTRRHGVVNDRLRGLLSYDTSSHCWNWTRLPPLKDRHAHIVMEGLLYSYNRDTITEQQVFNLHTRELCHVPNPSFDSTPTHPYVGMAVDTYVSPYTFQIILGRETDTQIYNSATNSWTQKRTRGLNAESFLNGAGEHDTTCAHCDGLVYITGVQNRGFSPEPVTYDLEDGVWKRLDIGVDGDSRMAGFGWKYFPYEVDDGRDAEVDSSDDDGCEVNLGAWEGSILNVYWHVGLVMMWELGNAGNQQWPVSTYRMPEKLYAWLAYEYDHPRRISSILTSFCGEYVLVYAWLGEEGRTERLVILDLEGVREWEKLDLPPEFNGFKMVGS